MKREVRVNIVGSTAPLQQALADAERRIDAGFGRRGGLAYHRARMAPLRYEAVLWGGSRREVVLFGRIVRRGRFQIGSAEDRHRELYRASWRRMLGNLSASTELMRALGVGFSEAARRMAEAVATFERSMVRAGEVTRDGD